MAKPDLINPKRDHKKIIIKAQKKLTESVSETIV